MLLFVLLGEVLASSQQGVPYKTVLFPNGFSIEAETVDTPETREKGLMFRDTLAKDRGMLFVFPMSGVYLFWMKNCLISLDIIWLNEKHEVIYLAENVPPCQSAQCPSYGPTTEKALYVLEVAAGTTRHTHLALGTKLKF